MTKTEAANFWKNGAADAFQAAQDLFKLKRYQFCLFFIQLTLEKTLKAVYINKKDESFPPTHDLLLIANLAGLELDEETKGKLKEISNFNVSARYDSYKLEFYKKATEEFTTKWFQVGQELYQQFLGLLP